MRILYELPKQESFFSRYASLGPSLNKLSYLAQIISGLTEYGVFFILLLPKVAEVAPSQSYLIAGIGAAILTAVVEIGMRKFAPYSVRTILYKRWQGLDLPLSIFIWLFTIGLFGVSLFTSFQGSKDAVHEAFTNGKSKSNIEQNLSIEKEAILKRFAGDSLQTAQTYDAQIIALQDAGNAAVSAKREQLRSIEKREAAVDKSFLSQKSKLREEIAATQAQTAAKVADLQAKKSDALALLLTKRENSTAEVKADARGGIASLNQKGEKYGGYLAWFTIICHIFFAIAITMDEIIKKGSDIEEKAIIGTYHFDQSILGEWYTTFSHKWQTYFRTKIRTWAAKTKEVPEPTELPILFEYDQQQKRVAKQQQVKSNPSAKPSEEIDDRDYRNFQKFATGITVAKCLENYEYWITQDQNNPKVQKQVKFWREKVIAMTGQQPEDVESVASPDDEFWNDLMEDMDAQSSFQDNGFSNNLAANLVQPNGDTTTISPNPKRVVIRGFQAHQVKDSYPANSDRYNGERVNGERKTRGCEHCNNEFEYKHWNAKYCSDDCRIAAWEGRTGRKFTKPDKRKRKTKRGVK